MAKRQKTNSYTFTGNQIGQPDADRYIIAPEVTGVSIAGVPLKEVKPGFYKVPRDLARVIDGESTNKGEK